MTDALSGAVDMLARLEDGTFVNMALVANGYAKISTYPPDVAFARDFQAAQALARQENRGLWGGCR